MNIIGPSIPSPDSSKENYPLEQNHSLTPIVSQTLKDDSNKNKVKFKKTINLKLNVPKDDDVSKIVNIHLSSNKKSLPITNKKNYSLSDWQKQLESDRKTLDNLGEYIFSEMPQEFWGAYIDIMRNFNEEWIINYPINDCKYLHKEFRAFSNFVAAHKKYVK